MGREKILVGDNDPEVVEILKEILKIKEYFNILNNTKQKVGKICNKIIKDFDVNFTLKKLS